MRKKYLPIIMEVLMSVFLVCSSVGFAFGGEFSPERLDKIHEEDKRWSDWLNKYIKRVLYIGMPIDEFVRIFTKDESWSDPERPYVINHNNSRYIIIGRKGIKYRVTFKDGLLEKLEQYTYDKIPIMTAHFENVPWYLKGERITDGLYQGMSEDEFLKIFSDKILMKLKKGYLILTNDGHKRGLEFTDGILTHVWLSE